MRARQRNQTNRRALAVAALAPPAILLLSSCELTGEEMGFTCGGTKVTQSLESRTPGWVQAGGTAHLDVKGGWFDGLEAPEVSRIVLTMPVPPTIAAISRVTFTGGTFTGTSSTQGGTLRMELTATGGDPELPTIGIDGTVKAVATDQVQWLLYDEIEITAGEHGHGVQAAAADTTTCEIDQPGYIVNFSRIGDDPTGAPTTATVAPPTTDGHGHTDDDHGNLASTTTAAPTTAPPTTAAPTTAPPTTKAPAPTTTAPAGPKTVDGPVVTHQYGPVQVQVTITGNRITDVKALKYPDDAVSKAINEPALPKLRQQVLDAQSADIAGASGATFTTGAYKTSLQAALDQAGFKK